MGGVARAAFDSEFLRDLERVLAVELREDLGVALKVAVLTAWGDTEAQMRARLGIDPAETKRAKLLLRRGTERLRREGEPPS